MPDILELQTRHDKRRATDTNAVLREVDNRLTLLRLGSSLVTIMGGNSASLGLTN